MAESTGFDDGSTLGTRFRQHAGEATHLYGFALRGMAQDWDDGGVVWEVCRDWEHAPVGSVVQLRLLAAIFRVVLRGDAPALAAFYPVMGGDRPADQVWPTMRAVVETHCEELRKALTVAPQTNEVARSQALLVGIFEALARIGDPGRTSVRLLELGASAGLNLNLDRYRFEGLGEAYGPADSALVLRDGIPAAVRRHPFHVVERRGCDLEPVDVTSAEGRLRLASFIWPFHLERHERLAAALAIAVQHPPVVDRAAASDWLPARLSAGLATGLSAGFAPDPARGVLTVVWQSITRMYWPAKEVDRVAATIASARERMPLVHVAMEDASPGGDDVAELRVDGDLVGTVGHHSGAVRLVERRQ